MADVIELNRKGQQHKAGVDLEGLMQILSKHLYSTPMVAVRELVQNAHDSIVRRRLEDSSFQEIKGKIQVIGLPRENKLKIIDTGAGLTEQEIHSFLATVGIGYTRTLREQDDETGLIGMFGLGFLSAFVLANEVVFKTKSYQTAEETWVYRSENAEEYSVTRAELDHIGTEITLSLKDDYAFLAQEEVLNNILGRYCVLLREPIHINEQAIAINQEAPPWRRDEDVALHPTQALRQNLAFASRFEKFFEPICTLPIQPDGKSDAIGLLWIQDGATYGTSDNRNLSIFLRGMLLDDNARDLLPAWAGFIGGVIESNKLVPTASREDLQKDANYDAIQYALNEAIITGLENIAKKQPEAWRRIMKRHNEALLGAALCDERLFMILKNHLKIPTSQGELLAKDLVTEKGIHVMLGGNAGFEEMLFRALQVPVAMGDRYAVVPFLRKFTELSKTPLVEIGTDRGNEYLFRLGKVDADVQAFLTEKLADGEEVVPAYFSPEELPMIVVVDREAELKKRIEEDQEDKKISQAALRLARHFTQKIESKNPLKLYINLNNNAIQALIKNREEIAASERALKLLKGFKTLMAGQEMQKDLNLNEALKNISSVIEFLLIEQK